MKLVDSLKVKPSQGEHMENVSIVPAWVILSLKIETCVFEHLPKMYVLKQEELNSKPNSPNTCLSVLKLYLQEGASFLVPHLGNSGRI